ncbi:MAG: hypothetical protein SFU98_18595 [Leptospiraceae bacterium]|nr:hypothetical protein [Leptospiraceae bacterium]
MSETIRIGDLNKLFESIQRDIEELESTKSRIPNSREYSQKILRSIEEEIQKLRAKKEEILNIEIKLPDSILERKQKTSEKDDLLYSMPKIEATTESIDNKIIIKKDKQPKRY